MHRRLAMLALASLVGLAGLMLIGCGGSRTGRTATATREEFRLTVQATGRLEAAVAFEVGPPSVRDVWNYNLKWMIPDGSHVEKGSVVARFDTTELDDRLREYGANLETTIEEREKEERSLEIQLRQLRLDLVKAESEVEKTDIELSVPDGLVSAIQIGQLRLERDLARKRVVFLGEKMIFQERLVKSKLDLLDVKRKRSEQLIAYVEEAKTRFAVKAPIDGLVVYIPKRGGDRWEVGERVWMLVKLMKIADVTTLRVEAQVLEVDAAKIEIGQTATVGIDAIPGLQLTTRVDEIGRLVRERSIQDPSKVFDAFLPIEELDEELMRPGMGIHAEITVAVLPDRITVPIAAIHASSHGTHVEVIDSTGKPARRSVELGPRNDERVVVESGLSAGEVVLLKNGKGRA